MISTIKNIKVLGLCLLGVVVHSCTEEGEGQLVGGGKGRTLSFDMTRTPQSIMDNARVYIFEHPTWKFDKPAFDLTSENDKLFMRVEAGTWNIAFVSADTPISSNIKPPVREEALTGKMWETPVAAGELPSMPELRASYLSGQQVIANQQNHGHETVMLYRNVAQVKVVIDKTRGLDVNGTHRFELRDVPTTLNWAGGLYPSKENPAVSSSPMKGAFTIHEKPGEPGIQGSDTLRFIIPAHRGNDFLGAHNDTTTHHLKLSVDLACIGGVRYEKTNVEIPRVPRMNGILLVKLSMVGELKVTAEVLDWVDVDLNASLSQTQLLIDRSEVGLSYKDTLYVNTNATNFTVAKDPAAAWITSVQKVEGNGVEIVANVDTYVDNQPRSSYITVTANNITKKIPVTQRPDRGTISVDNKRLVFCPKLHEQRSVNINSINGDWKFISQTYKATPNMQQGVSGADVTFTRGSTTSDDDFGKFYGDSIIVVKNVKTLDTDTIDIVNCFIYMYENTINANAPTGGAQSAVTVTSDVEVYGGSRELMNFVPIENWIYNISWSPATRAMTLTTDRAPDDEARDGTMSFAHAECPDYIVSAKVHQDIIVTIPPFDFFVVKFTWLSSDVDIAVEFAGNNVQSYGANHPDYDKIPIGFGMQNVNPGKGVTGTGGGSNEGRESFAYNGGTLLEWGGDATSGQGETAFFNAPLLEGDVNSPRKVNLEVYAVWWSNLPTNRTMTLSLFAYRGGTMQRGTNSSGDNNRYNFYNVGGVSLYNAAYLVTVTKSASSPASYMTAFEHVATVTYDRIKHSAQINMHVPYTQTARSLDRAVPVPPSVDVDEKPVIGRDENGKAIYAQ